MTIFNSVKIVGFIFNLMSFSLSKPMFLVPSFLEVMSHIDVFSRHLMLTGVN